MTLDEAWQAAEAALPKSWLRPVIELLGPNEDGDYYATARGERSYYGDEVTISLADDAETAGPFKEHTHVAALEALAQALRRAALDELG